MACMHINLQAGHGFLRCLVSGYDTCCCTPPLPCTRRQMRDTAKQDPVRRTRCNPPMLLSRCRTYLLPLSLVAGAASACHGPTSAGRDAVRGGGAHATTWLRVGPPYASLPCCHSVVPPHKRSPPAAIRPPQSARHCGAGAIGTRARLGLPTHSSCCRSTVLPVEPPPTACHAPYAHPQDETLCGARNWNLYPFGLQHSPSLLPQRSAAC